MGTRIRNRSLTFAVHLGPLDYQTFLALLPGGEHVSLLSDIVARSNSEGYDWHCKLIVSADALPPARLNGTHGFARDARLGGDRHEPYTVTLRYHPWTPKETCHASMIL